MTQRPVRRHATATAALLLAGALLLTGCDTADPPPPGPAYTPPTPPSIAQIAPLVPADPAPNDLENTPEVQAIRETYRVIAWANLTDDPDFAQVTQWIDPASAPGIVGSSDAVERDEYVRTGPMPFHALSASVASDGSIQVRTCIRVSGESYVAKSDGRPRAGLSDYGALSDLVLSPLTPDESAEVEALGLTAPALRIRSYHAVSGGCDASGIVIQQFESWRDVAPIGHY